MNIEKNRRADSCRKYLAVLPGGDMLVNLAGDYDYLELPYYISQDLENEGKSIRPTCKEVLEAYITPLFLEKAKLAGLPVPDYYISNGYFEPPVIIDPVNPFMSRSRVVLKSSRRDTIAKSMTRNYTYAICCQELPEGATVKFFRSVLGWCNAPRFRSMAHPIWDIFHIPLARVRVFILNDGKILLSDISQLPLEKLNQRERAYLEARVRWAD